MAKLTHVITAASLYLKVEGKLQQVEPGTQVGPEIGKKLAAKGKAVLIADTKSIEPNADKPEAPPAPPADGKK